jgi:hypothetical protein
MIDREIKINWAGCVKEVKPAVAGKNTQDVFVTLSTVNSGKKKAVDGADGSQSMLKLLPVNGKSEGENAFTVGETSRTETATSSKVTITSVTAGSTNFKAHMKSLAGFT